MEFTATFFYNDDEGVCMTESYESVYANSLNEAFDLFDLMLLDLNADDYEIEED